MTLLLQLTDCHLLETPGERLLGVDTNATLLAVLDQALAEATPDVLLLTGDLAHDGQPATYQRLRDQVTERYPGPMVALPGNHDQVASLLQVFPEAEGPDGVCLREFDNFLLVIANSQGPGGPEAALSAAARAALTDAVREADRPALLVLHHPLLPVGAPWLDKDCVPEGESLLTELAATGKLAAVIFGHVHQPVTAFHDGVPVFGSPSTCFQFAPLSERFSLTADAPGYRWVRIDADGAVGSTLRRLAIPRLDVDARFLATTD